MSGNRTLADAALLLARLLLALIFMLAGYGKLTHFSTTATYMASAGLPHARLLLPPAIALELGGALAVAFGWKARWGALALILFIIPTTLVFHAFWAADPSQAREQMFHFQKNLAIIGGLLYVAVCGAGGYSIDGEP